MKYYLIAGEASGDLHGARLIEALKAQDPKASIRCWGGDLMQQAGGTLIKHYRDLAFMGFWEVLINLPTILKNIRFCKADIMGFAPDVIIYIDYPGFNLRLAEWARKKGYRNHYYISPQLWAWKANRAAKMKRDLDALYTILPFEKAYFKEKHNYEVHYVGHPLLDSLAKSNTPKDFRKTHALDDRPIVALLPGSRQQEVKKMLPLFLKMIPAFPDHQFVIAGTPTLGKAYYTALMDTQFCNIVVGNTYALLQSSEAALVTSGTATLETALFEVPQVVCYKTSGFSYWLAKKWVTLEWISLVNLIFDREVVEELIQEKCTAEKLEKALREILSPEGKVHLKKQYQQLNQLLDQGGASQKTAALILEALS